MYILWYGFHGFINKCEKFNLSTYIYTQKKNSKYANKISKTNIKKQLRASGSRSIVSIQSQTVG